MKPRALARLAGVGLRRHAGTVAVAASGVALGAGALAFFLALGGGVRAMILGEVFPADRIEVVPPRLAPAVIGLGAGEPAGIPEDALARLRAHPAVRAAWPRMKLRFPARGSGGAAVLGRDFRFDLSGLVDGVDPALIPPAAVAPYPFRDLTRDGPLGTCGRDADCPEDTFCARDMGECHRPVPALVSRHLLELYNGSIAPAQGWPRLGEWLTSRFRGLTFEVDLGVSLLGTGRARAPIRRRMRLVGVSDRAIPLGLTVPMGYVRRWNARFAGETAASLYSSVSVEVRDKVAVTRLVGAVRAMGYDQAESLAETVGLFVTLATLVLSLGGVMIVALAASHVSSTLLLIVSERRRELGLLRALGATRADVRALVLAEAAAIGLAAGFAGLLAAGLGAWACDLAAARALPDFPYKPDSFFRFTAWIAFGCPAFAVAGCLLGAIVPASRAARTDPAATLSS